MRRRLVAALVVASGLATAGVAYAEHQPPDPAVAPTPSGSAGTAAANPAAAPGLGSLQARILRGAIHGELLVIDEDGATRTVTFDRGEVRSVSDGSITVARPDGVPVEKALTDTTVFHGTPQDQLQPGTAVIVVSSGDSAELVVSRAVRPRTCAERPEEAGESRRARIKDRFCRRLEGRPGRSGGAGLRSEARQGPAAGPSVLDDGFETIPS